MDAAYGAYAAAENNTFNNTNNSNNTAYNNANNNANNDGKTRYLKQHRKPPGENHTSESSTRGGGGGLPGAVRASRLAKKFENKTHGIFFQAAFDFDAPRPRNTAQK